MTFDLVQIRELAKEKEDENWRFRQLLKTQCDRSEDEIDKLVIYLRAAWPHDSPDCWIKNHTAKGTSGSANQMSPK